MAITSVGARASAGSGVSGTTLDITIATTLTAGNEATCSISADNVATTDGDHSEVTSLIDTQLNTWTKCWEFTNSQGAAAAGTTASLWKSRLTTSLTSADTVTVNFANAIIDKCGALWEWASDSPLQVIATNQNTTDGMNGMGSLTISGLPSKEYLWIRACGRENNSVGNLTPTTNFNAMNVTRSRNNAAAQSVRGEFRINVSTSETSNPTYVSATDSATVFVALEEQAGGQTVTPTTASLTTSQFAPVLKTTVTPATKSLTLTSFAPSLDSSTTVTPNAASLTLTSFAPVLRISLTPTTGTLTTTAFAPALQTTITPSTQTLTLTTFAPSIGGQITITPSTASLVLTQFAPTIVTPQTVTPNTANLTLTRFSPQLLTVLNSASPTTLTLTAYAPSITTGPSFVVTYPIRVTVNSMNTSSTISLMDTGTTPK